MAKNKESIYIDMTKLFGILYNAQVNMNKKDRNGIHSRVIIHCENVISNYAMAFNLNKEEDKMHYIDLMIGEFEILKFDCRFMIENCIIKSNDFRRDVQTLIATIEDGMHKWRNYLVDKYNKEVKNSALNESSTSSV